MTSRSSDTRAHPTAGRRRLSALVACLAFVFCCGQAAATSFQRIPLGNAVRDADVVVLGEVAVKEPLDPEHDVLVIKVGEMLKGDVAGKATIRVVSPGGRRIVVGFDGFKEGQQGIWLITKMKNRDAYYITMHPVHFQPTTAQRIIELVVAGTADAGQDMPQILREADGRARQVALDELCGPAGRAAALPLLLEWAAAPRERDAEIGTNVRVLAIHHIAKACDEGPADLPRRALAALDRVLAREPEKTESAWVIAEAYAAAGTIAKKHLGYAEAGAERFQANDFYPLEPRYHSNPEALRAAAPRHGRAVAAVKALRGWWATKAAEQTTPDK
jgi:hypothetical protein